MKSTQYSYQVIELQNVRYAVLRESQLQKLLQQISHRGSTASGVAAVYDHDPWDPRVIAEHLVRRREQAGITQSELARRAGVRVETLNRIERGKTTPDFASIRKLAGALRLIERRLSV